MTTNEKILAYLEEEACTNDLVNYWREYCLENGYYDDILEYMSDIGELYHGRAIIDMLHDIDFSSFDVNDDYFKHDWQGIRSYDDEGARAEIDFESLADFLEENKHQFNYDSDLMACFEDEDEDEQGEM